MTTSGSALDLRRRLFARESSLLHECMLSNECRRRGSEKGLPRKCFCLPLVVVDPVVVLESTDEALMLLGIKRPLMSDVG